MPVQSSERLDGLLPPEVAARAEDTGVAKVRMPPTSVFLLAVLAGAFIALGGAFYTSVTTGAGELPYGVGRALGGLAFCLGLVLVVVAGAELFTGNNLLVMAWASGRISTGALLRNWAVVFAGNFAGAVLTAAAMLLEEHHMGTGGQVGLNALTIAHSKCQLPFTAALTRGVYCNALVCLAVWLTLSCRSTGDKIIAILFPITAFVVAGFEHCVANMYFIPMGLLIMDFADPSFWETTGATPADFPDLTWPQFLTVNLLPVTLGNVIGGTVLVGAVYWFIYCRAPHRAREGR